MDILECWFGQWRFEMYVLVHSMVRDLSMYFMILVWFDLVWFDNDLFRTLNT